MLNYKINKMKKGTLIFAALISLTFMGKAQTGNKITANQKSLLVNKWFESPRESSGDTITFKTTKHVHQPGVDNPAFEFGEITFLDAPEFTVNYWRWCTKTQNAYTGKWTAPNSVVKLDFGKQKCKCELTILDIQKDKLKVVIKETSN